LEVAAGQGAEEKLADQYYVTVILRLLVNHVGLLEGGELVDTSGAARGRFVNWQELIAGLQRFLEQDASRDA